MSGSREDTWRPRAALSGFPRQRLPAVPPGKPQGQPSRNRAAGTP